MTGCCLWPPFESNYAFGASLQSCFTPLALHRVPFAFVAYFASRVGFISVFAQLFIAMLQPCRLLSFLACLSIPTDPPTRGAQRILASFIQSA
eukprot:1518592-Pleurochrysis_carterae.AAC.2